MNEQALLMWTLGPAEIVMLLVAAIFIFGPKRLPEIGKAFGETIASFRDASKGDKKALPEGATEEN